MEVKIFKCGKQSNLCDSCLKCFANCEVGPNVIEFGEGVGEDNVVQCDRYSPEEVLPWGVYDTTIEL